MSKSSQSVLKFVLIITLSLLVLWLGFNTLDDRKEGSFPSSERSQTDSRDQEKKVSGLVFNGETGKTIQAEGDFLSISEDEVSDGNIHFYHYSSQTGKDLYFFVIKASDGSYRVAANACEVCFGDRLGFRQVGQLIRCENCRRTYHKDQIAKQKGGCNPRPIDDDAPVREGRIMIETAAVESTADLF